MNKALLISVLGLSVILGCGKHSTTESEHAQGKARMFIDSLKHPTEKAIYASRGVATNLAVLATDSLRRAVLKDWANALLNLEVDSTDIPTRTATIRAAFHVLTLDTMPRMVGHGYSFNEMWAIRFRLLEWLDEHIERQNPEKQSAADNERSEMVKWRSYMLLVEIREAFVENLEMWDLDPDRQNPEESQLDDVRRKLERMIKRPVRRHDEIIRGGIYVKRKNVIWKTLFDATFSGGRRTD